MNIIFESEWEILTLGELFSFVIGGDWGKDPELEDDEYQLVSCIRGSEIRNWSTDKGITASLRKVKKKSVQTRQLEFGDLLIEVSGGGPEQPVGRTVVIDEQALQLRPGIPKICTNFLRLARLKPGIDAFFVDWFLKLFYTSGEIFQYQSGSNNLRNLKFNEFLEIQIPLPPLAEQQRIVAQIEALFSDLEAGKARILAAQQQLKTYRQAVLKWAFEGRLTREDVLDGELPEGWEWLSLADVSEVSGGITKNSKRDLLPIKHPFLRVGNVYFNELRLDEIHEIGVEEKELERALLKKGDLLFVEGNGSLEQIGRVAVWDNEIQDCVHQNHLIKARPNEMIYPKFALHFYCSPTGRDAIKSYANSTSGLHTLSTGKLKNLPIPLPPLEEQHRIVQEIESRLGQCDAMEAALQAALQDAEALRQSILKQAFEGKL